MALSSEDVGVAIDDSLGSSGDLILKFCSVSVLVRLVGSEHPVSSGVNSLLSISISVVQYVISGAWFGYENDDRLLAFTKVVLGWTLSRLTV